MTYIDCTDGDDWYEDDRPGMYGGGDIEPDARDYATDSNYCIHGSYIGTPWGADYICGYCEDGVSAEDFAEIVREQEEERERAFEKRERERITYDMVMAICTLERDDMASDPDGWKVMLEEVFAAGKD